MSPVPVSPRRVFGVDFSAAEDAGNHIWVCRAHPGEQGIRIESVDPLSELPGGAVARDAALRALVHKVGESPRSAWGFDFSFALPAAVIATIAPGARGYGAHLDVVASFGDAETMRDRCAEAGAPAELRRRADDVARTPFSPHDRHVYKQTFHGMVDVLRPLRGRPEVAVLPFDPLPEAGETGAPGGGRLAFNRAAAGRTPHIYVMEVCPSSVLSTLEIAAAGYDGDDSRAAGRRRDILGHLADTGVVRPTPRALRRRIIEQPGGDALDAVLAAIGAWRGYRTHDHGKLRADPAYGREGFVYT